MTEQTAPTNTNAERAAASTNTNTAAAPAAKAPFGERLAKFWKKHDAKILLGVTAVVSGGFAIASGLGALAVAGVVVCATVGGFAGGFVCGLVGGIAGLFGSFVGNIASVAMSKKDSKPAKKGLGESIFSDAGLVAGICATLGMAGGGYLGHNQGLKWFGDDASKVKIEQTFNNSAAVNAEASKTISYAAAKAGMNHTVSVPAV